MSVVQASPLADLAERTPYARQLDQGFGGLRFAAAVEQEFREEFRSSTLRRTMIGFGVAAAMYLAFFLIKLMQGGAGAETLNNFIRLVIIAAMALPVIAVKLGRQDLLDRCVVLSYLVLGVGISSIEALSHHAGIERHYEGLIFASMHCYLFSGLRFRRATACALMISLIYVVIASAAGMPARGLAFEVLFLVLANLVGTVAGYQLEFRERDNFLRRQVLDHLARYDGLTGLMNRSAFFEHLREVFGAAAERQKPVCLIVLDIDHFKHINDSLGHLAGDRCLRQVADIFRSVDDTGASQAARWGGDEFLLVCSDCTPDRAGQLAGHLRERIQALEIPLPETDHGQVTASIGYVVLVPKHADIVETVIGYADKAVYHAKASGRNRADRYLPGEEASGDTGTHPAASAMAGVS